MKKKERIDRMALPAAEKRALDAQDISRPYQRKRCRTCGKEFRTCSGGRVNCVQCSPAGQGARIFRLDPALKIVKAASREKRKEGGDVIEKPAAPEEILQTLRELDENNLSPKSSAEAIILLGRIGEHMMKGRVSALRARALSSIVRLQIGVLQKQEALLFKERVQKERDARRRMSEAKRLADKEKRDAEKRRRREELKNNGGKPKVEVPLPQLTPEDERLGADPDCPVSHEGPMPNDAGDGTEKETI